MMRMKHSRNLRRAGRDIDEEVDPTSSLANLSDCMLVLAVGLMIALVAHYNVDMRQSSEVVAGQEVSASDISASGEGGETTEGHYTELGRVYRDEDTGKWYMVQDD